jgi:hypothetical protein
MRLTVTGITGTFQVGEVITVGTLNATIWKIELGGTNYLYVRDIKDVTTGAHINNLTGGAAITGLTSGATATYSARFVYVPTVMIENVDFETITGGGFQVTEGEVDIVFQSISDVNLEATGVFGIDAGIFVDSFNITNAPTMTINDPTGRVFNTKYPNQPILITANKVLNKGEHGRHIRYAGAGNATVTFSDSLLPIGYTVRLSSRGSGTITIAGGTTYVGGSTTVASGSSVTVIKTGTSEYEIYNS